MLWPSVSRYAFYGNAQFSASLILESPYPFSIKIDDLNPSVDSANDMRYDFFIEGINNGHFLQLVFLGDALLYIDGLVIQKKCVSITNAPYTDVGTELTKAPFFFLQPLAKGNYPKFSNLTITQSANFLINVYSDAVVFSFEEFHIAGWIRIAEGLDAGLTTSGCLAALIFRANLAEDIARIISE